MSDAFRLETVWLDTPALTATLLKRGYSEPEIKKIMGGNFLRVMREVVGK